MEFFGCNPTFFGDYNQYKNLMETKYPTVSAKNILELTNNEGLHISKGELEQSVMPPHLSPTPPKNKEQSFLTTFAELILFGPFFYQLFTDETPHKNKQTIFEAFDE